VTITDSRHSFADTVSMLTRRITDAGNTIFASIDQTAAAVSVGLSLRPTTLIVFGNPKGGTPLMEACPPLAMDLPLKILIWEEEGRVRIGYVPVSEIVTRYGVTGMEARVEAMDRALDGLANAL